MTAGGSPWQSPGSWSGHTFSQVRGYLRMALSSHGTQARTTAPHPSPPPSDTCLAPVPGRWPGSRLLTPPSHLCPLLNRHHGKSAQTYARTADQARVCLAQPPTGTSHAIVLPTRNPRRTNEPVIPPGTGTTGREPRRGTSAGLRVLLGLLRRKDSYGRHE